MSKVVKLSQDDREAAATLLAVNGEHTLICCQVNGGKLDDHDLVQAFARHRLAAYEQCARVCDDGVHNAEDWDSSYWDQACQNRAIAIRSLANA